MKNKNIRGLTAFIIAPAMLSSSVLAGPGPQSPTTSPKRTGGKAASALQRPKVTTPTVGPKGPVTSYPPQRVVTAGHQTMTVSR